LNYTRVHRILSGFPLVDKIANRKDGIENHRPQRAHRKAQSRWRAPHVMVSPSRNS